MRTIAIIPARGGSKRLKGKNIYPLNGKPLIAYTIEACKACPHIDDIYVSSDDDEILKVAEDWGAIPLKRPAQLADDTTPKIVAMRQAAKDSLVIDQGTPDVVIIPQANSPEISADQMNRGFELMNKHGLWEVMSCDDNGVQNAAFRILKYDAIFNEFLSAHCGFVVANNLDVHDIEDIRSLEKKWND
jgi:CMP-N,N'-diacetyllegionaminic acid synthase